MSTIKIKGYQRSGNLFGIRNHIVVMSSVSCANFVVEQIARTNTDIIPITHQHGCTHMGADTKQVLRTLSGTCNNPNVGGVLLVGLGCESVNVNSIASQADNSGKLVKTLVIQEIGEIQKIIDLVPNVLSPIDDISNISRSEIIGRISYF